jgi:hypothetical protein
MCLQVASPATERANFSFNGLSVVQKPCNGSPEQTWDLVLLHRFLKFGIYFDSYHIVNRLSGKCMVPANAERVRGASIHQWECGADTASEWLLVYEGSVFARIQNVRGLLVENRATCLAIRGGSLKPDAPAHLSDCSRNASDISQRFSFKRP